MGIVDQGSTGVDNLIAAPDELLTKIVTLAAGQGVLPRGTVLGKITAGAASKADKTGGNTGNGTLTLDVTTPKLTGVKAGVYTVRVIRAAVAAVGDPATSTAMKAIAELKDPDGDVLQVFDVPTTPGITVSNQVKFAMVEGNTPFALGDGFDITVAAGSGQYKKVDATAIDGSQAADCILIDATDATSAVKATAYKTGMFNRQALTVADGDTVAAHEEELRKLEIHLQDEYYHV